jgi:hypothetical protein
MRLRADGSPLSVRVVLISTRSREPFHSESLRPAMAALASLTSAMCTKAKSLLGEVSMSHSVTLPNFSNRSLSSELRADAATLPT